MCLEGVSPKITCDHWRYPNEFLLTSVTNDVKNRKKYQKSQKNFWNQGSVFQNLICSPMIKN